MLVGQHRLKPQPPLRFFYYLSRKHAAYNFEQVYQHHRQRAGWPPRTGNLAVSPYRLPSVRCKFVQPTLNMPGQLQSPDSAAVLIKRWCMASGINRFAFT